MDYQKEFETRKINEKNNTKYQRNDIGTAKLFFDLHKDFIAFVPEINSWLFHDGQRWRVDKKECRVNELFKDFVESYALYAKQAKGDTLVPSSNEYKSFSDYTAEFHSRQRRKSVISDSCSIAPISISDFDKSTNLLNCENGTFDLEEFSFRPHDSKDLITKMARVKYVKEAVCKRWEQFIDEVMCSDKAKIRFLQKILGYCLSGGIWLEKFFIFYGATTRNGKTTLAEVIAYLLGDYSMTIQPQTLARRSRNGAAASPDIVRLKGARFVNTPEPPKGLELDCALIKQFTGADTVNARGLYIANTEFVPEFKIFFNTNYLPKVSDNTIFKSERIVVITFDRHFLPEEQNPKLKHELRQPENLSGILNWLIEGYRMLKGEGLEIPTSVSMAMDNYEHDLTADMDSFFNDNLIESEESRTKTSDLYRQRYVQWAKEHRLQRMSSQKFMDELRQRYEIKKDRSLGNVVVDYALK